MRLTVYVPDRLGSRLLLVQRAGFAINLSALMQNALDVALRQAEEVMRARETRPWPSEEVHP
jgi:hypothetical protein